MSTDMQRARELLPCPWCGSDITEVSVSNGSTFRWRKIDGCCTDGPEVRHDTISEDQESAEIESRRRAIEAWNRRTALREVPEGYVIMPVACTEEMEGAYDEKCIVDGLCAELYLPAYDAMIAARPQGVK